MVVQMHVQADVKINSLQPKRYHWWHGVAFYAGVQVARLALRAAARRLDKRRQLDTHQEQQQFYNSQKLPVFAPPAAAFPIAWSINSVAAIAGGLHVLNLPRFKNGRSDFLLLQAGSWALFSAFDTAYFGLRSPLNAAVITALYSALTAASINVAARRMHDSSAISSLVPTAAWLALANPLGIAQAAFNRDSFWQIGPLIEPSREWLKAPGRVET
jgi:tryptophan-rich sensory protein